MTTLTALAHTRTLFSPGPLRRGFVLGFLGTLAVGFSMLAGLSLGVAMTHGQRIMPGVWVGGVEVAGLDRSAAAERLEALLPSLSSGTAAIVVDGTRVSVPYAEIGRAYQLERMLDAAFGVARSGNPVADSLARIRALGQPTTVATSTAAADAVAIGRLAGDIASRFAVEPVDGAVTYDPARGFEAVPAVMGAELDVEALAAALAGLAATPDASDVALTFETVPVTPDVTTRDARAASIGARWMSSSPLGLRGAGKEFELPAAAIAGLIGFETNEGSFGPVVDQAALVALLEPFGSQVKSDPQNASFTWNANGIAGVVPGAPGRELDLSGSVAAVFDALKSRGGGSLTPTAALAVNVTQPALTTAAAQAAAPQMRRLSTWTTYYVPGEGNYWNANIHIAAWDLDGMVLAPGEWFSFWDDIGPVTLERGYGYGGAIINGRSVPNGALAGGICSTSTTLFNAAMRSGLEIGERTNHSYYIERYPVGLDATVLKTDTWETDMTFRNDTATPVVIRSYTGNGWVRFDIWGVPDGRTVTLSSPVTSNHRTAIDTVVVNPRMAPGTSKRVEYPHNGFHAVVTRWVRDADGDLVWENVWQSNYRTVNGEVQVGPTPAPEPSTPEPEPTEPPTDA